MRPTVWRFARELGLAGEVVNDGDGVLIRAGGPPEVLSRLIERIRREAPPLARIEQIDACVYEGELPLEFRIGASKGGRGRTQIAPDAAMCAACAAEVLDPAERRYWYPFATCTHCGPRLTIVTTPSRETAIPTHWREVATWLRRTNEIARMKAGQAELRRIAFVAVVSWRPM